MTRKSLLFGLILVALVMAACGAKPPGGAQGKEPVRQAATAAPAQKEAPPPATAKGDEEAQKSSAQSFTPESKKDTAPRDLKGAQARTDSTSASKQTVPGEAPAQPQERPQPKLIPSDITEDEQALFIKYSDAHSTPNAFNGPIEDVNKFLEIMLKAEGPYQLRWFVENIMPQEEALMVFDMDMGTAVGVLSGSQSCQKDTACFDLILRVYHKAKGRHKETLMNIAMTMKRFEFNKYMRVEILRTLAKDHDQKVRLETAASFLALGLPDEGLPLLEQLAREGRTYALPYLFKSGWGNGPWEFCDERGLDILKRALDFPMDEIRAEAAIFLGEIHLEEDRAEKVAFDVLMKYRDMTAADFGLSNAVHPQRPYDRATEEKNARRISAMRACDYAMQALGILHSKRSISSIKKISSMNNDWFYICKNYTAQQVLGSFKKEDVQ